MTAYEILRQEEQDKEQERFNRTLAKVKRIRIRDWEYQEETNEDHKRSFGHLTNDSIQGKLHFSFLWNEKTKLHIGVSFPADFQGKQHFNTYRHKWPSINVSIDKTPEQISKDIERRLLPEYLKLLAEVRETIQQHESYLGGKSALGRSLAAEFPRLRLHDSINGADHNGYKSNGSTVSLDEPDNAGSPQIEVACNEKTIDVELKGLTLEEAKEIIAAAFRMKDAKQ